MNKYFPGPSSVLPQDEADQLYANFAGGILSGYQQVPRPPGWSGKWRYFQPAPPQPQPPPPAEPVQTIDPTQQMGNDTRGEDNERWREGRRQREPVTEFRDAPGIVPLGLSGAALSYLAGVGTRQANKRLDQRLSAANGVDPVGGNPWDPRRSNTLGSADLMYGDLIGRMIAADPPKRAKTVERENSGDRSSPRGGGRGGVDYDKLGRVESRPNYGGPR